MFEQQIIPQFFKHSKFSSFVRQLNFYGFRKIKFSDTIKIDEKLEAETSNFWRFRHEKFIRGRPDLLVDIKRSKSQDSADKAKGKSQTEPDEEVSSLKTEVDSLKDRITTMSMNINQLTSLVQSIHLSEQKTKVDEKCSEIGHKRKKIDTPSLISVEKDVIDATTSMISNSVLDSIDISENSFCVKFPETPLSSPLPTPMVEESEFNPDSLLSQVSAIKQESSNLINLDDICLDEFYDFGDEGMGSLPDTGSLSCTNIVPEVSSSLCVDIIPDASSSSSYEEPHFQQCTPEPVLMKKLSNALSLLPKDVQEILVNRLISTITSSDALQFHIDAAILEASSKKISQESNSDVTLPLAAATLDKLISQYSTNMKNNSRAPKCIPIIPVHA